MIIFDWDTDNDETLNPPKRPLSDSEIDHLHSYTTQVRKGLRAMQAEMSELELQLVDIERRLDVNNVIFVEKKELENENES